jgi:hypothetical protein
MSWDLMVAYAILGWVEDLGLHQISVCIKPVLSYFRYIDELSGQGKQNIFDGRVR